MYSSLDGILSKAETSVPKFFAMTSFGTCASQSVSRNVLSSENVPLGKTRRNSAPLAVVFRACR
jgi:hypothetical protein